MSELTEVFHVGPVALGSILAGTVVLLTLAFEQLYTYWNLVERARDLGTEVGKALYRGDLQAARTMCERSSSPVADVFIAALNKVSHPGESVQRAAERERQRFGLWMKRRLWAIGTVGAIAPFVGLFGTVVGIIRAFHDIAQAGAGGFSVVAEGVSEALVATAGGIGVAVLAVALYNYFQSRANVATVEVKLVVDEFLEQLVLRADTLRARADDGKSKGSAPADAAAVEG
ncbi:MotA/TolQ/ExbB proton channel family protein [Myxococcota bacterium]|nr:MotA/TolQ/ExbB proton channel family protein [Myxococcota bacterium]